MGSLLEIFRELPDLHILSLADFTSQSQLTDMSSGAYNGEISIEPSLVKSLAGTSSLLNNFSIILNFSHKRADLLLQMRRGPC